MSSTPARRCVWTVVVAGGAGRRFGVPKQFVEVAGRPVVDWAVAAAASVSVGVVVVLPPDEVERWHPERVVEPGVEASVVPGGSTRSDSVRRGLAAVPAEAEFVLVHDAARPAASPELFARVVEALSSGVVAVVPAVDVVDTLRARDGSGVDRDGLVVVQTPQGFAAAALRAAHAGGADASDDASLVEAVGGTIVLVPGETTNTKLTNPIDLPGLEATLAARLR